MTIEYRTSYRFTSTEPLSPAVVQLDDNNLVLNLVDQSAEGFGVEALKNLNLQPGQIVKLRTNAGWSECEVIHKESEPGTTRIGLRRLNELPDPRQQASLESTSLPQTLPVGFPAAGDWEKKSSPLGQVLGTVVLVIVGFWIAVSHPIWLPLVKQLLQTAVPAAHGRAN